HHFPLALSCARGEHAPKLVFCRLKRTPSSAHFPQKGKCATHDGARRPSVQHAPGDRYQASGVNANGERRTVQRSTLIVHRLPAPSPLHLFILRFPPWLRVLRVTCPLSCPKCRAHENRGFVLPAIFRKMREFRVCH